MDDLLISHLVAFLEKEKRTVLCFVANSIIGESLNFLSFLDVLIYFVREEISS